jgi:hypothetical protein
LGLRAVRKGLATSDRVIIEGVQRAQAGKPVHALAGRVVAGPAEAPAQVESGPVASTATAASGR